MRIRLMPLFLAVAMLVAAITPTTSADALPASSYAPAEPRGDDPPAARWLFERDRPARQVSGLPWSRVWVERNWHANKGR